MDEDLIHGGTDGGPEPHFDFSTNVHPLGPNPFLLAEVVQAKRTLYPDPFYHKLRQTIALHHGIPSENVAVGSGASEIIHRLVRWNPGGGPVLILPPTFGEYARAVRIATGKLLTARTPQEFLNLLPKASLAFLCIPNNPTGEVYPFLEEAQERASRSATILVLDLTYYPLMEDPPPLPYRSWKIYSPSKAHGMPGIRAGYIVADRDLRPFHLQAPSWVLSSEGEAFLSNLFKREVEKWLVDTRPTLWQWRRELASDLLGLGLKVWGGKANFLLAYVGNPVFSQLLRQRGIRVRESSSFGLEGWIRISSQPPSARIALIEALKEILDSVWTKDRQQNALP
jgi:histidinol-phosphate aminotransferase